MGQIGLPELILILLVALLLFGAKRLPEIGSALGKAIKEFRKAARDVDGNLKDLSQDQQKSKDA